MIERFGPDRICVAGACDWGPSDPIAVPRFIMEMRRRRHPEELIQRVVFDNPVAFLSQSPKFKLPAGARREAARGAGRLAGYRRVQLDPTDPFHLTYCTNIHPADGWDAVFENARASTRRR